MRHRIVSSHDRVGCKQKRSSVVDDDDTAADGAKRHSAGVTHTGVKRPRAREAGAPRIRTRDTRPGVAYARWRVRTPSRRPCSRRPGGPAGRALRREAVGKRAKSEKAEPARGTDGSAGRSGVDRRPEIAQVACPTTARCAASVRGAQCRRAHRAARGQLPRVALTARRKQALSVGVRRHRSQLIPVARDERGTQSFPGALTPPCFPDRG